MNGSAGGGPRSAEPNAARRRAARLFVLAGVDGAGKSSVVGAAVTAAGGEYFNPDEAARGILVANPGVTSSEANAAAWVRGRQLLERAISERLHYAFETTLGGTTITRLLVKGLDNGLEVHVRYVGLEGVELHLERVRARVASGGNDIPEAKIRERYDSSRRNLIRLLPRLTELTVFDNSIMAPPMLDRRPKLQLLLHAERGAVLHAAALETMPEWAKPIVMAALRIANRS